MARRRDPYRRRSPPDVKVLDLFAGLGGWSRPAIARGDDVVTVDFDERFGTTIVADVLTLSADELGGPYSLVVASPPCEAFSTLAFGFHWFPGRVPKTEKAATSIELVRKTIELVRELDPPFWIIENPVGMLRKLPVVGGLERRTVTYCRFGEPFRKPTDLWGGFPPSLDLPPVCRAYGPLVDVDGIPYASDADGRPCHISAPRGSTTGIQGDRGVATIRRPNGDRVQVVTRESRRGGLGTSKWLTREVYGTADMPTLAALRAVVPYGLAVAVLAAAEADLEAGRRYEPFRLFA